MPDLLKDSLIVGAGGFLGAIARFLVGTWIVSRYGASFPWATFGINVSGSFLLGLLVTLFLQSCPCQPNWRLLLAVGFLGAYTTFSTFEYESARSRLLLGCPGNLLGSVVAGYLAVWLGIRLGQLWPGAGTRFNPRPLVGIVWQTETHRRRNQRWQND